MVRLQINLIGAGALPYISDLKFFMPVYRQAAGAERKYTGIILQREHGGAMLHRFQKIRVLVHNNSPSAAGLCYKKLEICKKILSAAAIIIP